MKQYVLPITNGVLPELEILFDPLLCVSTHPDRKKITATIAVNIFVLNLKFADILWKPLSVIFVIYDFLMTAGSAM